MHVNPQSASTLIMVWFYPFRRDQRTIGFDYGLFVYKAILEANQSDLENYLTKGLKTLNCWVEKPGDEKPINQILMMNRLKKKYKEPIHLPFAVDTLPANTTMNDYFDSLIEHAKVQKKL